MYRRTRTRLMGIVLTASLLVGCGESGPPPSAKVSGEVTYNGQPVTDGEIYFVAADMGYSSNASLDSSGKYQITSNLPSASYKVYFAGPKMNKPPMPGQPPPVAKPSVLPAKFMSEMTSEQSAEVKSGTSTFDFKLTD